MGKHVFLIIACIFPFSQGEDTLTEPTCRAGDPCSSDFKSPYFWPYAHGHPNYYGNPPWPGPTDLQSSMKWRWNGPTGKLYSESFVGVVIDDKKNIYVNGDKAVYKLSPDGQLLWSYNTPRAAAANGPALMDGVLYGDCAEGYVYAVDMESGKEKWAVKASNHNGGEYGHIAAHNGIIVTEGDAKTIPDGHAMGGQTACGKVRGLNATDGRELWVFEPEGILWDWFPQFPDDDTVIFMEQTGMLYRLGLQNGTLIWKAGGIPKTWTDGCQMVAANGLVYAVAVDQTKPCPTEPGFAGLAPGVPQCPGIVSAHRISDGSEVFRVEVPKPPNTAPVVGRLGTSDRLALVMPIGQQTGSCEPPAMIALSLLGMSKLPLWAIGLPFLIMHNFFIKFGDELNWVYSNPSTLQVMAFDAETGSRLWSFDAETDRFVMAPGDRDGLIPRFMAGIRAISCPTPWSAPRIGSDGTIYVGSQNGNFYAIRDKNGDNHINRDTEVSTYETKGVFTHVGSAHAPGMIVAVNFDSVFVFKS